MFMDFMRFCRSVNTIRESTDRIRMSADKLIVFLNAIRIFSIVHIAGKLPLQKHFPENTGRRDIARVFFDSKGEQC